MKFSKFCRISFQSFIKHFVNRLLTMNRNINKRIEYADQMLSSGVLISENKILEILQNKFSEFY